jgi:hypothetical protein
LASFRHESQRHGGVRQGQQLLPRGPLPWLCVAHPAAGIGRQLEAMAGLMLEEPKCRFRIMFKSCGMPQQNLLAGDSESGIRLL